MDGRQVSGLNERDAMELLETLNAPGPLARPQAKS